MFFSSQKVEAEAIQDLQKKLFSYRTSLSDYLIDFSKRDQENDWPNQIITSFNGYPENLISDIEENIQDKLKEKNAAIVETAHILLSLLENSISAQQLAIEEIKFLRWALYDSGKILPTTFNVSAENKLVIKDSEANETFEIQKEVQALVKSAIVDYLLKNFAVIQSNIFQPTISYRGRFQLLEAFSSLSYLSKQIESIKIISDSPLYYAFSDENTAGLSRTIPTIDPLFFWSLGRLKARFSRDLNEETMKKLNGIYEGRSYFALWRTLFWLQMSPEFQSYAQSLNKIKSYWRGEAGFFSAFKLSHEVLIAILKLPRLLMGGAIALTALTSYPFYWSKKLLKGRRLRKIKEKSHLFLEILEGLKDVVLLGGLTSLILLGIYFAAPALSSLFTLTSIGLSLIQNLNLIARFQYLLKPVVSILTTVAAGYTITSAALFVPRLVVSAKKWFDKGMAFFKSRKSEKTVPPSQGVTQEAKVELARAITAEAKVDPVKAIVAEEVASAKAIVAEGAEPAKAIPVEEAEPAKVIALEVPLSSPADAPPGVDPADGFLVNAPIAELFIPQLASYYAFRRFMQQGDGEEDLNKILDKIDTIDFSIPHPLRADKEDADEGNRPNLNP